MARKCSICGKPITAEGYIVDDGAEYYCSDGCLSEALNKAYGSGNWWAHEDENEAGGYYSARQDGETVPLPIYWTEWEEDLDEIYSGVLLAIANAESLDELSEIRSPLK